MDLAQRKAALQSLAVQHHGALFGYCRKRLQSAADAEDALQETFLRAHKYFDSLDPARDARRWLFGIAHNVCVEIARARGKAMPTDILPEVLDDGATGAAFERIARAERAELVRREVERLPERARRILELRFFGQLDSAQIGELEGMNEGAVRVALHRALEGLRSRIGRTLPGEVQP